MEDIIVKETIKDINSRSKIGLEKYNKSMNRNDLSVKEWIQHAYEESLDKSLYLKKLIKETKEVDRYKNLEKNIVVWGYEKEILTKGTPLAQQEKTEEEVAELREALETNNKEEIIDALGDILVTIILQSEMQGLSLLDCLESAYNVIRKRQGKIINGQFVKNE